MDSFLLKNRHIFFFPWLFAVVMSRIIVCIVFLATSVNQISSQGTVKVILMFVHCVINVERWVLSELI